MNNQDKILNDEIESRLADSDYECRICDSVMALIGRKENKDKFLEQDVMATGDNVVAMKPKMKAKPKRGLTFYLATAAALLLAAGTLTITTDIGQEAIAYIMGAPSSIYEIWDLFREDVMITDVSRMFD